MAGGRRQFLTSEAAKVHSLLTAAAAEFDQLTRERRNRKEGREKPPGSIGQKWQLADSKEQHLKF